MEQNSNTVDTVSIQFGECAETLHEASATHHYWLAKSLHSTVSTVSKMTMVTL